MDLRRSRSHPRSGRLRPKPVPDGVQTPPPPPPGTLSSGSSLLGLAVLECRLGPGGCLSLLFSFGVLDELRKLQNSVISSCSPWVKDCEFFKAG